MTAPPHPLLQLTSIHKSFPGCTANDDVNLSINAGEVHALFGENGAGKSTLVKIIYGVLKADAGVMRWNGAEVTVGGPAAARRLGIGMVFQHFSLFDALTVEENIALGLSRQAADEKLRRRIGEVSAEYGLPLDPGAHVHSLSVGERQRIEIVRCLLQNPRLLIMDEPTSVLTPQESEKLFATLRRLAAEGCAILYISHKLREIRALCESATVMRGGRVVARCDPRRETTAALAQMMVGETVRGDGESEGDDSGAKSNRAALPDKPALAVNNLSLPARDKFGTALSGVTFTVHGGEVLGIAGVAGNGQAELTAALAGEMRATEAGAVVLNGSPCGRLGVTARRALGLVFVPEERLGRGAVPEMSLVDNALLSARHRCNLARSGILNVRRAADYAGRVRDTYRVQSEGIWSAAASLSGGNLQKFIVGREILQHPAVLVAAQPTWGVDAGSVAAIHRAIRALAAAGAAVVVVSQDLDELFAVSDRMAVIYAGRVSAPVATAELSAETIGLLMSGAAGAGNVDGATVTSNVDTAIPGAATVIPGRAPSAT
ncbi:MAG: ABC transporter ATP-binding protein [Gammaproteobacteria bacterium]|nr:ABC transporter ATP-binding protein [Gammaproteobacteria bacterium]